MPRASRAARAEFAIDGDQVLNLRDLGRDHYLIAGEADLLGECGAAQPRFDQRLAHDPLGVLRLGTSGVLDHERCKQVLVEAAPIDSDPYRPVMGERDLDHGLELRVAFLAKPDIARIDPVLVQGFGTSRVFGEQPVTVVV